MIYDEELKAQGLIERTFPLPPEVATFVEQKDWPALDRYFLAAEKPQGLLFDFFCDYLDFTSIEHIISFRQSPGDEEGIWHDDGSRILGFSLSLTRWPLEVEGGQLLFRAKDDPGSEVSVSTRPFGTMLIFKTGVYGFEHKVTAVRKGARLVIAGWCS